MNVRLNRWITASIAKYLTDNLNGILVYIQNDKRQTETVAIWVEIRIRGPEYTEFGNAIDLTLGLNVLVNVVPDGSNSYTMQDYTGIVGALFSNIPIFRYGLDVQSDATQIGCLQLDGKVKIRDYGRPDVQTNLLQSTVEGNFKGTFGVI